MSLAVDHRIEVVQESLSGIAVAFFVAIISMLAILVALVYVQPRPLLRALALIDSRVLYFVATESRVVALTIDDSPHPDVTPLILDVLRDNDARATFFVLGEHAIGNEHLINRIRDEGHELGNHLMRDYPSLLYPVKQLEQQLVVVDKMLQPSGPVKWFRPGSGWYSRRMIDQIQSLGYRCALGSVYPFDLLIKSPWLISQYVLKRVFPGAIIILHDGREDRSRTIDVLKRVLPELRQRRYKVLTLSELVSQERK